MTLRETVTQMMVARHSVREDLARQWVAEMDDVEVQFRLRTYQASTNQRCADCYFLGVPCAGPGHCGCGCHMNLARKEAQI